MSFFEGDQTKGDQSTNGEGQNTNQEDWLDKVVQEKGEQWKEPQTLAKGYYNAQEYIKQLEQQAQELREDLGKQEYTKELLEKLSGNQATTSSNDPQVSQSETGGVKGGENTTPELNEETLTSLIEQTLTKREKQNTAAQNLTQAQTQLKEMFGTETEKVLQAKVQELGISEDKLKELASESPTAFFQLIGEKPKQEANPVIHGTVNTSAGFTHQSTERNFQHYQKLRRDNSKLYYSPKVQNQMLQDRIKLGDKFYN